MDGKWESTRDLPLIVDLHRAHNPGLFDLAGQYSNLHRRDLSGPGHRCYIYRTDGGVEGFAVARLARWAVFFEEMWCPGHGTADMNVVGWDPRDIGLLSEAHGLMHTQGKSADRRVLFRVPTDNTFGLLLAKRFELPLENSLLLATREPGAIFSEALPPGHGVRPYRPGDEVAYAAIHNECFNEYLGTYAFRRWATKGTCEAFSAAVPGRVVGFTIAEVRRGGRIGDFNLAVAQGHCHRGFGTALLAAALASLRDRGVEKVVADHWALNGPAVAFYRCHGFKVERAYYYFRVP